jgi:hypothetical protein
MVGKFLDIERPTFTELLEENVSKKFGGGR